MERPQCCIERCPTKTKTIKVKDVIYYLFPTDKDWADKWQVKIKEFDPNYRRKSNDIVCSLHFDKTSMKPVSRQLVDHALPINFPQKLNDNQKNQNTPRILPTNPEMATITAVRVVKSVPDSTSHGSKCCIVGCPTKFDSSAPKIHGYRFPENVEQRKNWIFIIESYNNQKIVWEKSMRICALHFNSAYFTQSNELMEGAKPSVFKHAVARRQMEIAKQLTKTNSQPAGAIKTQSINVPLHRASAGNHSMTQRFQRSGQIIARRLSLPYSNLPPLLPKPTILKRLNQSQINSPNGVINVHHINAQKAVLSPSQTATELDTKATLRPVPALNKVVNVSNVTTMKAKLSPQNVALLRKSMPLPSTSNAKPAGVAAPSLMPIKRAHITRLPPTLKPAPRIQTNTSVRTYSKIAADALVDKSMPVISRVQNVKKVINRKSTNTPPETQGSESAKDSSPVEPQPRVGDVIVIEDEESEIAKSIKECKSEPVPPENSKESSRYQYIVRDESVYQYPSKLLDRILTKKRKNADLEQQIAKLRKLCHKMSKQIRLQTAITSGETIEIS